MKWPDFRLVTSALCGAAAAADITAGALGNGWAYYLAGGMFAVAGAINFSLFMSTRKADEPVATNPGFHSGGYISSADYSKALAQALSSRTYYSKTYYSNATTPARPEQKKPEQKKPEPFHGLPFEFAVGEVYGLRMWHLDPYGRLRARNWEGAPPWRPGVNVAKCVKREPVRDPHAFSVFGPDYRWVVDNNPGHDVPSESCACGFYAYTDSLHAEVKRFTKSTGEEPVLGIIKGTGRTLIGTQGFRCEKAEVVAFRDPTRGGKKTDEWRTRQLAHLRRVYPDVPILGSRDALLEFAPLTETLPDPSSDEFWSLP